MYKSYVYKITNKVTNQFYFGSRTENVRKQRHPEDDLWKHYFTSSKKVKKMIEEYGLDAFDVEILSKHDNYEDCFWQEQRLILETKNNPLRLNKAYVDPHTGKKVLTTFNETEDERQARMKKMSNTKKGKFNSNGHYGLKHSEETKAKMKLIQAARNFKHSDENKKLMSDLAKEKVKNMTDDERKERFGAHNKGKPWSEARRKAYEQNKLERIKS